MYGEGGSSRLPRGARCVPDRVREKNTASTTSSNSHRCRCSAGAHNLVSDPARWLDRACSVRQWSAMDVALKRPLLINTAAQAYDGGEDQPQSVINGGKRHCCFGGHQSSGLGAITSCTHAVRWRCSGAGAACAAVKLWQRCSSCSPGSGAAAMLQQYIQPSCSSRHVGQHLFVCPPRLQSGWISRPEVQHRAASPPRTDSAATQTVRCEAELPH